MGLYRVTKWLVRVFYPKIEVFREENLPDVPCLVVGNHSKMNGPISCELYFPGNHYIWCAGQMTQPKEVSGYAYQDFWSEKPRYIRWFYKLLSYMIAPFSVCIFGNAQTIAVYRDARIISTFKNTVKRLNEGANVVIFPECNEEYNHIVHNFQDKFIDIARLYYKKTGEALAFVPLYIAPNLKQMHIGMPIWFDPTAPMDQERRRICDSLMEQITAIATGLPRHRVVPYPKYYQEAISIQSAR